MFVVQLYSIVKEYFELNGVKNKEAAEDMKSVSEMYDEEYINKLLSIADSLFTNMSSVELHYSNEEELANTVFDIQYEIEEKIKAEMHKLAEKGE